MTEGKIQNFSSQSANEIHQGKWTRLRHYQGNNLSDRKRQTILHVTINKKKRMRYVYKIKKLNLQVE